MNKITTILLFFILPSLQGFCQSVSSPNGNILLTCELNKRGTCFYNIIVDNQSFIKKSKLGFTEREGLNLSHGYTIEKVTYHSYDSTWTQLWGENKTIRNHYNEMCIMLKNKSNVHLILQFRIFDDGIGFRYHYSIPNADSLLIMDELTEFNILDGSTSWSIPANFDTYELLYRTLPVEKVEDASTPFTFKTTHGLYASIHEAALVDFPEMTLTRLSKGCFKSNLAPWPDGVKARFVGNCFTTPWRVILITPNAVGLVNSNLILNLNEPCQLTGDLSWIRPMKYVGIWWGMHLGIWSWTMDVRHGATTVRAKQYIDFAAKNHIEAVLFEGWNEGWETWGSRQHFDFTKPYQDFDMDEIARYAKENGVQIIGHHETGGNIENYESQLDRAYAWYAQYGVHNVKTGYAGGVPHGYYHHGQYAVRHYQRVVETAAKYHTTLDVHEPIKATGLRRTYPNMMTREGARGMEWNAWSKGNPPEHHEILPFTRLLGGPMDYTPGVFDILYDSTRNLPTRQKWNDQDQGDSRVNTTLAKQLANWVILYSPLQMACDLIENYKNHPAFQFFRDLDVDYDWSEALQGEPGQFIVMARRSGDKFYLAATTNEEARTVTVPLNFLKPGRTYHAVIYADAPDADWQTNPTAYSITEREVKQGDTLTVVMAKGGGQAIFFKETNN